MTPRETQTFGRTKILKATGLIVAIYLVIFMYTETRGDFANGILFFIEEISSIHFAAILTILFGLTFLFGGMAGKEIILKNKNHILTSLKYAVLIILAIVVYAAIIGIAKDGNTSTNNLVRLLRTYFFTPLAKTGLLTFIPLFIIWLWATNQMRLKISDKEE